jgi:NADH-quinone oxidoreductase subunit J
MTANLMFYVFTALTALGALGVVFNRNTVNAAMCFLLSLVGLAGLFVLLEAYLLAVLLVFVYAGAVVTLFLFIVMLLDVKGGRRSPFTKATGLAATVAAACISLGLLSLYTHGRIAAELPAGPGSGSSLKGYAYQLFTTYLLPVQIVGFLLLMAMLGVIVISKRQAGTEDGK